ncbi:MAG: hypothetical protein COB15_03420 [Flavobacteriales bacterium]|nr:MAG: hypothetical protein COB15_03420 [Flavobacteriales bacterium]
MIVIPIVMNKTKIIMIRSFFGFFLCWAITFNCYADQNELVELRNMYSNTYLNEDGSKSILLNNEPINYFEKGMWLPIKTDLFFDQTKSAFVNQSNTLK